MTVIAVVVDVVAVVAVTVNSVVGAIVLVVVVVVAVVGDRRGDGEWRSHCYPEVEVYKRKKKECLKAFFLGRDFVSLSIYIYKCLSIYLSLHLVPPVIARDAGEAGV